MRTAVGLLEIFTIAIVLAFSVTVATGTTEMRLVATAVVTPITFLSLAFIYYCRKRKAWSYEGACILGAVGIILRVVVSTQPSLEVGGGLPVGVTALYIVLGALVSLTSYESLLELRS
jgi:FtsH-binding integral membrane protein